jgi:hypothetical protein
MSEKEEDEEQLDFVLEKLDKLNTEFEKSDPGIITAVANPTID